MTLALYAFSAAGKGILSILEDSPHFAKLSFKWVLSSRKRMEGQLLWRNLP